MLGELPESFDDWEGLLVSRYLTVGPDGDASVLHNFDISADTLSRLCGAPLEARKDVEAALRATALGDPYFYDALRLGACRPSTEERPNFFFYLVITLYVDSLLEGEYASQGIFREKLAQWLGVDRGFQQLRGVAQMWRHLEAWLAERAAAGAPVRRLRLPKIPTNWTHIGYTRRLSFPGRGDLKLMLRLLAAHPSAATDPRALLDRMPRALQDERASWGIRDAFDDFRAAFFGNRRALAEHRLWRLVKSARLHIGLASAPMAIVDLTFDEDGDRIFLATVDQTGARSTYQTLEQALAAVHAEHSDNLSRAVSRGVLIFSQSSIGRWRAADTVAFAPGGVHIAVRANLGARISAAGAFVPSGDWAITEEPISISRAAEIFKHAGLWPTRSDALIELSARDGIRVGRAWLGRPRFLPTVHSDASDLTLRAEPPLSPHLPSTPIAMENGELIATASVEGTFRIESGALGAGLPAHSSLRLTFESRALPHSGGEPASMRLACLRDWSDEGARTANLRVLDSLEWEAGTAECADLLEALYADGAAGWDEADLVALIRRAGSPHLPWTLLRTLQDAGLIEPRLRRGWRGRVWTLKPPRLVRVGSTPQTVLVVEGALCERLIDDFALAACSSGARVFRRLGVNSWSPPIIGMIAGDCDAVARKMGWPLPEVAREAAPGVWRLITTPRQGDGYVVGSVWDWRWGRFLTSVHDRGSPQLLRMVHPDGIDHDIYVVKAHASASQFLSRTAAIVAAHALARRPVFKWCEGKLIRLAADGGAPDLLAAALRRRMLRTAGPTSAGYAYPASEATRDWFALRLGAGSIEGADPYDPITVAARARRLRQRVQWRDGTLRCTSEEIGDVRR